MDAGVRPGVDLDRQIARLPGGQLDIEQFLRARRQHADFVGRRRVLAAADGHQQDGDVLRIAVADVGEFESIDFLLPVKHLRGPSS